MVLPAKSLAALALALAGCGGGGADASTDVAGGYAAALDSACQSSFAEVQAIPQKQVDENLTVEEAQALANDAGQRFEQTVSSLRPPDDLRSEHERLLETIGIPAGSGVSLSDFRARSAVLIELYANLGADRCGSLQQRTLDNLENLPSEQG